MSEPEPRPIQALKRRLAYLQEQEAVVSVADEKQGGHAFRVIAAYARWLGEGPELAILRLLGLFDRPAEAGALNALRATPPIPGLTEPLVDLSEVDWHLAIATLREDHSLLAAADAQEPDTLDAHPLVRACFAEELESHRPDAWQEGNRRLYEHLRQTAPDLPGSPGRAPGRRRRSGSGRPAGRCWNGRGNSSNGVCRTIPSSTSPSITSPWAAPTSAWP